MKSIRNILCVTFPWKNCQSVVERAVVLAENNQASLTVVSLIERFAAAAEMLESEATPADLQALVVQGHEQHLATLIEPYQNRKPIQTKVLTGIPFLEIVREVLRSKYDLVIKPTEAHDWLDRLFSSDDMHLLRKCPCPVWLIKPEAPKTCRRILAAVDVGEDYPQAELQTRDALNRQVLEMAGSLALSEFAELHIAHVWDAVGESLMRTRAPFMSDTDDTITQFVEQVRKRHQHNLDALMREMTRRLGQDAINYLKPQIHLINGSARKEVPALARQLEADLIVMGTVARTGIPGFIMGNTAEAILNQIDCSVLAIKPPGFVTPVTLEV
jgi:nucleotide-binding universal stress UspA family protein